MVTGEESVKADKFINIVRRFTEINELSQELLHEFIEKVAVHEGEKSNNKRIQQVDIYLKFIGRYELNN